jgi:hypothetical protein
MGARRDQTGARIVRATEARAPGVAEAAPGFRPIEMETRDA